MAASDSIDNKFNDFAAYINENNYGKVSDILEKINEESEDNKKEFYKKLAQYYKNNTGKFDNFISGLPWRMLKFPSSHSLNPKKLYKEIANAYIEIGKKEEGIGKVINSLENLDKYKDLQFDLNFSLVTMNVRCKDNNSDSNTAKSTAECLIKCKKLAKKMGEVDKKLPSINNACKLFLARLNQNVFNTPSSDETKINKKITCYQALKTLAEESVLKDENYTVDCFNHKIAIEKFNLKKIQAPDYYSNLLNAKKDGTNSHNLNVFCSLVKKHIDINDDPITGTLIGLGQGIFRMATCKPLSPEKQNTLINNLKILFSPLNNSDAHQQKRAFVKEVVEKYESDASTASSASSRALLQTLKKPEYEVSLDDKLREIEFYMLKSFSKKNPMLQNNGKKLFIIIHEQLDKMLKSQNTAHSTAATKTMS